MCPGGGRAILDLTMGSPLGTRALDTKEET
jgi:hypothetical protein